MHEPLSEAQLQAMFLQAAEAGARKALARIGLHDKDAPHDLRELRGLLEAWRDAKRTVTQTVVRALVLGVIAVFSAGAAVSWWKE